MNLLTFLFALVATLVPSALAHGRLRTLSIDGTPYQGNTVPPALPIPNLSSPIRQIQDISPIKGATNRDINCGKNAMLADMVAPANPGSNVTFDWGGGNSGDGPWPHNLGPMLTYMSTCENTTCDKFDAINAKWFKIDQLGQRQNGGSEWFQKDLFDGKPTSVTLPQNLAPGDYLLRHEIISLHVGNLPGGAEFYVACSQLRISANNNLAVQPSQTVALPGAYSDNDPGILVPSIFDPVKNYQFPGPPISNVVAGSSPAAAAAAQPSNVPSGSSPAAAAQPSNAQPSNAQPSNAQPSNVPSMMTSANASCSATHSPRQLSRVMVKFKRAHPLSG